MEIQLRLLDEKKEAFQKLWFRSIMVFEGTRPNELLLAMFLRLWLDDVIHKRGCMCSVRKRQGMEKCNAVEARFSEDTSEDAEQRVE